MTFTNTLRFLALSAIAPALAVPVAELTSVDSGLADGHPMAVMRPAQWAAQPPVAQQVVPQSSLDLHYSTESGAGTVAIPKLVYPAINAVGASAITNVVCSNGQAHVTFANDDAFNQAFAKWPTAGLFTMVTFSESCGTGTADSTHDFILVHKVVSHAPQTLSMVVTYQDIQLEQAVHNDTIISVRLGSDADNSTASDGALEKRIGGSKSKTIAFSKYPADTQSPWGPAYKLYSDSKVSAYCVGCGADASITFTGSIEYSILHGLQSASLSVHGNLNAAAVFGLDGKVGVKVPLKEITLVQLAIEGLSIPEIASIGPIFTLGAGGSVSVDASGQLEVGTKLHWPQPNVDPVFDASGSISSTLDLHLTNSLGFGVSIPPAKFNKQVALVDQPGVQVTAGVQGSASFKNGSLSGGLSGTCQGIAISAYVYNHLFADLFGIKKIALADWTSKSYSHCVAIH
ncbi:hypothetical protein AMS68_001805 [Peltaster fructicola]|uniref:Uncharacterized protein n=1 Tax=Peltaster fructicola TaxID=286661 RepID=A0A6H0XNT6_9PEZI|nr:hypothetical protein AMS68_001805 [Peltaster fructicola]